MHPNMSKLRLSLVASAVAVALVAVADAQINDSIRGEPSEANHFIGTPDGWEHPRTPWGDPDIQAILDMRQAGSVPLQRCQGGGFGQCDLDQVWIPEEQYEAAVERTESAVDTSTQALAEGNLGLSIRTGLIDPSSPLRQTSLIMDPPNGRLPELTEAAKRQAYSMGSDWALPAENIDFQDQFDFDSWDRCITRGMPSMMMPYRYNGGFKIHQSPGYVIFDIEMIHEARIIPIGDAPPLDPAIRQYLGESRGHWEGNTLVLETTNYNADPDANIPLINLAVMGSPPGNRFPISDQLKTTERITRLNDEWWMYEITTEDPDVLTEPFTVRYPMYHDPDYWWPEYACHEDNTIVRNYTETNRYERANPTPEPPQEPVAVSAEFAELLPGRWVGSPETGTIEYEIEIEFTRAPGGAVNGNLIGSDLGAINKPLRNFSIGATQGGGGGGGGFGGGGGGGQNNPRAISWQFPNVDPWSFRGTITEDGEITGTTSSAQGGVPLTFRRVSD
jgi:hypothetical protein